MKRIAIIQSNYIPWKGYFDLIAGVDELIIYDDVQYTRRDWRNRNTIKTVQGLQWLTVPVKSKGNYLQKISEVIIDGKSWKESHWKSLSHNYKRAPYFKEVSVWLEPLYLDISHVYLSKLNRNFIDKICLYLEITTTIKSSSEFYLPEGKTERLASLCKQTEATEYVSGPSAKKYIDKDIFDNLKINISWMNYENYKIYPQLWGNFNHKVTILDLLFNCGKNAKNYMKFTN